MLEKLQDSRAAESPTIPKDQSLIIPRDGDLIDIKTLDRSVIIFQ